MSERLDTCFFDYSDFEKICIIYTLKCTARCSHCMTESSPKVDKKFELAESKRIIDTAFEAGKRLIVLSGGEVFIYLDELYEMIEYITAKEMDVMVESNGYWAKSEAACNQIVKQLKLKGLSALLLSYDYYHSKYVPLENIRRIFEVSKKYDLKCEVTLVKSDNKQWDSDVLAKLKESSDSVFDEYLLKCGRGEGLFGDIPDDMEGDFCDSLLTTITPYGDVFACCNINPINNNYKDNSLYLGNIYKEDLKVILNKELNNSFLNLITAPGKLFEEFVKLKSAGILENEDCIHTICDICLHIARKNFKTQ